MTDIGQWRGDWEDAVSSESYDQCLASLERIAREQGGSTMEVTKEWEQ